MRFRSLLFAPAARPDLVGKLARSAPDAAIVDLEDSVPLGAKTAARDSVGSMLDDLFRDAPGLPLFVRVNGPATPFHQRDLDAVPAGAAGVVVPKVERASEIERVRDVLRGDGSRRLRVVVGIETVASVARVDELLAVPGVDAAYFGAEDYVTDLGGVRTEEGLEVLYARSRVAMAARLAGVAAIDQVVTALHDESRFAADASVGRSLGYVGKLCIHPEQVPWANRAFTPDAAEVERAQRMVAAYDEAAARGEAAIAFDGEMIDEPLARRARTVLDARDPGVP